MGGRSRHLPNVGSDYTSSSIYLIVTIRIVLSRSTDWLRPEVPIMQVETVTLAVYYNFLVYCQ